MRAKSGGEFGSNLRKAVLSVLDVLSRTPPLSETFCLKGGTALRYVYFADWRHSVDLDFSVLPAFPAERLRSGLRKWMATHYGGQRLDLLAAFANDPDLAVSVDTFTPRRCKAFLQPYATGELVLVDEMEFLWHRWDEAEKREFLTILQLRSISKLSSAI